MKTDHEEADTKIAHLIQHAISGGTAISEICVRSSSGDIDIPVILVGLFGTSETIIKVDNGTGKNRKMIQIDSSPLSTTQQKALVGFHAYTGNDYVSSLLRKTKKMWASVVAGYDDLLSFFCKLGENDLTDQLHQEAEKFVCKIYGHNRITSVNELQGTMFWQRLIKNDKVPDLSILPPCSSTLRKHTARAHYIATMWKRASVPVQALGPFENNGWLPNGTIDWVDCAYPNDVGTLFSAQNSTSNLDDDQENQNMHEIAEDDGDLTDDEDEDLGEDGDEDDDEI